METIWKLGDILVTRKKRIIIVYTSKAKYNANDLTAHSMLRLP